MYDRLKFFYEVSNTGLIFLITFTDPIENNDCSIKIADLMLCLKAKTSG